jgi:hypothetical protein
MRRFFAALASVGVFTGLVFVGPHIGAAPTKLGPLPDSSLTPGASDERVTQDNVRQTICVPGYTKSVRRVSSKTKSKVFAEYDVSKKDRSKYVINHLIALELGGSNDIEDAGPVRAECG